VAKFTTDYVNLIANNLRDRYRSGFPILKELVQNADDAGATALAFGYHEGLADKAEHELLQGPALWVLNNGRFNENDMQAIRSFGVNSKAAESGAIGKFGLGMKSVFHLCEAFFYLASDGAREFHEVLSPWFQDVGSYEKHEAWNRLSPLDVEHLGAVARSQPMAETGRSWFLLWVPLRRRSHVPRIEGENTAPIIDRYPGDDNGEDLDFFSEPGIDQRVGNLLPLLRRLVRIQFGGTKRLPPFELGLVLAEGSRRLDHESDELASQGSVSIGGSRTTRLHFRALQRSRFGAQPFAKLQTSAGWPKSNAIVESGKRAPVPDKGQPEGAVLVSHADGRRGSLSVQWAVFLPTEELRFRYEAIMPDSPREISITLHGQFFVDAGRRGIEGMDRLADHIDMSTRDDGAAVQVAWNQALAQLVVLPMVLPAIARYVQGENFGDEQITALTRALTHCSAVGDSGARVMFHVAFGHLIHRHQVWVRVLERAGAAWKLLPTTSSTLLLLPRPVEGDRERPWRVLPGLQRLHGVQFVDMSAPAICPPIGPWSEEQVCTALEDLPVTSITTETGLRYLDDFLRMHEKVALNTERVRSRLVVLLRQLLAECPLADVRAQRQQFRQLIALLPSDKWYGIGTRTTEAKGSLPEGFYKRLAACETEVLLLPADLTPDGDPARPPFSDIETWLRCVGDMAERRIELPRCLDVAELLIGAVAGERERQGELLRRNPRLKVLRAFDVGLDQEIACSLNELLDARSHGELFRATDAVERLGLTRELASAAPGLRLLVIRGPVVNQVRSGSMPGDADLPAATSAAAMFRCIGEQTLPPELAETKFRLGLLRHVGHAESLDDQLVRRGIRYLLHGQPEHFASDTPLWKDPSSRKSAWVRLWRMVLTDSWNVLPEELGELILDTIARVLDIRPVDESTVAARLRTQASFDTVDAAAFTESERDLILGQLADENVWRRLPLHRDGDGGFGPVDGSCYLGGEPRLPSGLCSSIRFIVASADEAHLRRQRNWLRPWSAGAAASEVLRSGHARDHWRYLMDLLPGLVSPGSLPTSWHEVAWLPLANGRGISLSRLIQLDSLGSDIRRLAAAADYAHAGIGDLAEVLVAHAAFDTLQRMMPPAGQALAMLGQLMSRSGLLVGRRAVDLAAHLENHVVLLSGLRSLPAWTLVAKAIAATSARDVEVHMLGAITAPLLSGQAEEVLDELANRFPYSQIREVFLLYLKEWTESASATELRSRLGVLSLPAADGDWRAAAGLVHGASGTVAANAVEQDVANVLGGIIVSNSGAPTPITDDAVTESRAETSVGTALEQWSESFEQSAVRPAIGALMGVFGDGARSLAESWLAPISFQDFILKINWKDPGHESGLNARPRWMGGHATAERPFGLLKPVLLETRSDNVRVKSLTGADLYLPLEDAECMSTLRAGPLRWLGGYGVEVRMRPIDSLESVSLDRQKAILQATAESLLREFYTQDHANLTDLWNLFEEADQVELDVAQSLILDGLPQLMGQLPGVKRHPSIACVLEELDKGRRDLASAERAKSDTEGARARIRTARDELERLVVNDASVQEALLEAIRGKLVRYQYEHSSIPFEILQNADDAVVEYQELQRAEGRATFDDEDIGRFVVVRTDEGLVMVHWGRPINHTGRKKGARSEYAKDLERMLMLGASAKELDDDVTGKFGLGFKSIFLAADRPLLKSGDLQFEIVGGCLPRRAALGEGAKKVEARFRRKAMRPTVIELPIADNAKALLARFRALGGLCTVFSRQIRRITVDFEEHEWKPVRLLETSDARCEIGVVQLPHKKDALAPSRVLVLRSGQGAVLVRLDGAATQFDEADIPVPAIWVHAPTRGTSASGLVLNADFEIDTGRGTLAQGAGARRNRDKACDLADRIAPVLAELVLKSRADWETWSERLDAGKGVQPSAFWHAFWTAIFVEAGNEASQDVHLVAAHARRLFEEVLTRTGLVPNGLPGDLAGFAEPAYLRLAIRCERLSLVLPVLQRWSAFMTLYPVKTWCGLDVHSWLAEDEDTEEEPSILELDREVVLHALGNELRLAPEHIEPLAAIILAWPQGPTEVQGWRNGMALVQVRSRAGSWKPAYSLYMPVLDVNDPLAAFLSDDMVIDEPYAQHSSAWNLLIQYLQFRSPPVDELVRYAVDAMEAASRAAVVSWLARSLDNVLVWNAIRWHLDADHWLSVLREDDHLLGHLSREDRIFLLGKLHPENVEYDAGNIPEPVRQPMPSLDLIHDWWMANRLQQLPEYDRALWPNRVDRVRLADDEPDRDTWMTLFSLGVFRRLGRVRDQQNRAFLDFLHERGWWSTISKVHPDRGAEQWMGILREYAEANQVSGEFEQWMDCFPRMYRLARWCDEYVELFRGLQFRSTAEARLLLTPAADSSLSGSGFDAPTLHRTLHVGHNLVIRELLRTGVLSSDVAQSMAFMPGAAVLELLAELGHHGLERSEDIHKVLVEELGSAELASFGGDFDVPLILLATNPVLRDEVWAWFEGREPESDVDTEEELS